MTASILSLAIFACFPPFFSLFLDSPFSNFLDDDLPLEEITRHHIEAFFSAQTKVSNKTILNYHVGLSALWTWAVSEHIVPNRVVREVTQPKIEQSEQLLCM